MPTSSDHPNPGRPPDGLTTRGWVVFLAVLTVGFLVALATDPSLPVSLAIVVVTALAATIAAYRTPRGNGGTA